MPTWVEPQLATLTHERFSDPDWIYERKLDGERCLAFVDSGEVRLLTRNKRDITTTFPEITKALLDDASGDLILDGEIVAFEDGQTRFSRLQQRLGITIPGRGLLDKYPVYYYLFDVLYAGGKDTRDLPQRERKRLLSQALKFRDTLRFTEHRDGDGEKYYGQACRDGWEGLIAKRADAPYEGRRSRDWLKFKCENSQEMVIGGFTDPQGSRTGFGALLLGYYEDGDLVYAGKVGTGFDRAMLRDLRDRLDKIERSRPAFRRGKLPSPRGVHWTEPRLVAQVAFTEWTEDGQLRHPRFQGLRDDKDPREVVRER
jgi:bifunctional non-homologous end joining protein LigD